MIAVMSLLLGFSYGYNGQREGAVAQTVKAQGVLETEDHDQAEETSQDDTEAGAARSSTQEEGALPPIRQMEDVAERVTQGLHHLESELRQRISFQRGLAIAWPVEGRVIASYLDRSYYMAFGKNHGGIDIASAQGGPVASIADGIVLEVSREEDGFSYVVIAHRFGLASLYGHLSDVRTLEGAFVRIGDVIGQSGGSPGTTGAGHQTTGPHLHLELFSRERGEIVRLDPAILLPHRPGDPPPQYYLAQKTPPATRLLSRSPTPARFLTRERPKGKEGEEESPAPAPKESSVAVGPSLHHIPPPAGEYETVL